MEAGFQVTRSSGMLGQGQELSQDVVAV